MKLKSIIPATLSKKAFSGLLILFFSFGLFAAAASADGCSAATGCFHCDLQGPHPLAGAAPEPMPPGCPEGSCDFENSTVPAGLQNTIAAISADNSKVAGAGSATATDVAGAWIAERFIPLPVFMEPAAGPPAYLLNRSLLC